MSAPPAFRTRAAGDLSSTALGPRPRSTWGQQVAVVSGPSYLDGRPILSVAPMKGSPDRFRQRSVSSMLRNSMNANLKNLKRQKEGIDAGSGTLFPEDTLHLDWTSVGVRCIQAARDHWGAWRCCQHGCSHRCIQVINECALARTCDLFSSPRGLLARQLPHSTEQTIWSIPNEEFTLCFCGGICNDWHKALEHCHLQNVGCRRWPIVASRRR